MANPAGEPTADATPTAPPEDDGRGWRPYRLSVRQYLKMIAAGVFPDDARVELLGGLLVEQMTKGTPHDYSLSALCDHLRSMLPAGMILREDKSLRLGPRSRPEPDIAIVVGPRTLYKRRDPDPGETSLIVEVGGSTYRYDRGRKWRRYAAAGVPSYWIVNLKRRQVEVYRDPAGAGESAAYRTAEVHDEDASVPLVLAGVEVGRISVADILP